MIERKSQFRDEYERSSSALEEAKYFGASSHGERNAGFGVSSLRQKFEADFDSLCDYGCSGFAPLLCVVDWGLLSSFFRGNRRRILRFFFSNVLLVGPCYGVCILLERVLRSTCHEVFGIVAFFRRGDGLAENDAS